MITEYKFHKLCQLQCSAEASSNALLPISNFQQLFQSEINICRLLFLEMEERMCLVTSKCVPKPRGFVFTLSCISNSFIRKLYCLSCSFPCNNLSFSVSFYLNSNFSLAIPSPISYFSFSIANFSFCIRSSRSNCSTLILSFCSNLNFSS